MRTCLASLAFFALAACSPAIAAPPVATLTSGDPGIKSIDAIGIRHRMERFF